MEVVKKSQAGGGVAVKIEAPSHQPARMFGRHFDEKDEVISHISRDSIDVLKVSPRQLSLSLPLLRAFTGIVQERRYKRGMATYQEFEASEFSCRLSAFFSYIITQRFGIP